MESANNTIRNRRIEQIKQAFINGEYSYDSTVQKLYTSRVYYSLKNAKNAVDSWQSEVRRTYCPEYIRLPRVNE